MSEKLIRTIPGNVDRGIIRNQELDIGNLPERLRANEFLECKLWGTASPEYGHLGPNLISCEVREAFFPTGVSHFDAKDSTFVDVRIYDDFTRIMVTRCVFKNVAFTRAVLRDTVFLESHFEDVVFEDCDFSVAVFKSNLFIRCTFRRCRTDNKLFEHCVFDRPILDNVRLQELTVLQNFGLRYETGNATEVYAPDRDADLVNPRDISPSNALERVSLEYFLGGDLDASEELWNVVNLRLGGGSASNALHVLTAIEQLARFLLLLFSRGELRALFIVQLLWSLDRLSDVVVRQDGAIAYIDRIQASLVRLRPIYEQVASSVPAGHRYAVLVHEQHTRDDLAQVLAEITDGAHVIEFRRYNSPSIAQLVFDQPAEAALIAVLIVATRFKLEIDAYQPLRKFLTFETKLIGGEQPREYAALVAMNLPGLLFARMKVGVTLSSLERLRAIILTILTTKQPPPLRPDQPDNPEDS